MMELQKIEALLLQEMEDVKGGRGGSCQCEKGAGQGLGEDGTCICSKGGAGQKLQTKPSEPVCVCSTMGGAGQ